MRVGIIGAGITGLALTHYLAERGIESLTFEATAESGGAISTRHVDGHVLEAGPQRMRKTPGIEELARVGGVEDDIIETHEERLYVYANGALSEAPLSKDAFFRTSLLSWRGKARLLAEPLTRAGRPEETVEEVFERKFGREAYERFVGPLYGGLYGSDPAEMPAAFALEGLLEREQEAGSLLQAFRQRVGQGHTALPIAFTEGNQQLPEALAEVYSDRIELETPVTAIREANTTGSNAEDGGPGYVLVTPANEHEVDAVVVTTPAHVAADILTDLQTAGVADGISGLSELRYNPLALVFLHADHDRAGKGYQVGYDEDLHTLGVSWNATMFGRDGVHTAFLGGMHEPELLEESDERLGEIAREEFEHVMGCRASLIDVARLDPGFPAWDQSWWNIENVTLPAGVWLATNYTARMGIPSRVREAREIAEELAGETADADSEGGPDGHTHVTESDG